MDPMLRGGQVGGLLRGAAPPAAIPSIEVLGFEVEDGVCRYATSVRVPSSTSVVHLRWSKMETIVKELRALFPAMPDELGLPKYYFTTTDDAKLERRRQELNDFWGGFMAWLDRHSRTSAEQLLDSEPMQHMLEDAQQMPAASPVAAPSVGARSTGTGGAYSSSVDNQQFLVLSRGPGPRPPDQPSPEAVGGVVRKGTLRKLGGKQKNKWQTRDVELSIRGGLKFSSGSALRDTVLGSLQLSPAEIVSVSQYEDIGVKHAFEVESLAKEGKVYQFMAESETDCNAWVQGIQDCIAARRVNDFMRETFGYDSE